MQIPCKSLTLSQIWAACQKVAAEEGVTLGKVNFVDSSQGTTTCKEINVCPNVSCAKAEALGLPMAVDLEEIILDYIKNYVKKE